MIRYAGGASEDHVHLIIDITRTASSGAPLNGLHWDTSALDENGQLRYQVNGQDILIRGAGWTSEMMLRYSAERFDLFYPGYGDSWPSLMGAVGMTFEVGGGGGSGNPAIWEPGNTQYSMPCCLQKSQLASFASASSTAHTSA